MRRFLLLPSLFALTAAFAAEAPPDFRYKVETLLEGSPQPMEFALAPDGRIFFIEIGGAFRILKPATKELVEAGKFVVTTEQENGLLGMALDPDFAHNQWIYFLRSPKDFEGQVLSRFTMQGDKLDLTSEKELLRYEEQHKECCHHAGCLRFGPDGCLYFSAGDNTNPFASDGWSPHDEQPGRGPWDAQKSSANMNDLRGGISRIKPTPDGKYTIPEGNLFPAGTPGTRPEVYVKGCRNPWRFNIDQKTGILYYGDVGNDAGDDNAQRGPRGYDLVNQVRKPSFFGWPYFRGNNYAYAHYDFATKVVGPKWDSAHPVNNSPNNTGIHDLPPAQPAWIYYPYAASKEFPELGKGGRTACGGPVFHWQPEFEKTNGLPKHFDNCLLIYDWQRPFIKWVRLDAQSNRIGIEEFTHAIACVEEKQAAPAGAVAVRRPVDMAFGPDGCLYLFDYGATWGVNKDSKLLRISYQAGNLAPVAVAGAKNATGREPLIVDLSADGSKDFENDPVTYEWRLQPGDKVLAKSATAKVTIAEPGNYHAELRVTDDKGATGTATVPMIVGNTAPTVEFVAPRDGDFFTPGRPVKFNVAAHDAEDGESSAKADEFGYRTQVSATWRAVDGKAIEAEPGFALMKQSDCFNCHAIETQIVGPPLLVVAARYRGQAGAENATVERVIKGSTGVWSQVGMLPHPQHTEDEVHLMVRWIFGLEAGKATPGLTRGLAGEILAPADENVSGAVLEALFTDAGRPPVAALSSRATIQLRGRRLLASKLDQFSGPTKLACGGCTDVYCLGSINHGNSAVFPAIDLADVGSITARASSGNVGGKIEFHAGSATGALLGSVDVPNTGGWNKWITPETKLAATAPNARTDIVAVFVNPGQGGLMNLDWVQFNPR
jgi:cytochrome c